MKLSRNSKQQCHQVLIMAGGTGGHVYPALAVAEALIKQGIQVSWLGTPHGIEATVVVKKKISFHPILIYGLRGKGLKRWLLLPWHLLHSLYQSLKILKTVDPCVVLGMGGYVSGPGAIAAWILKKPILIHEQNAIPGFTNKMLSLIATYILESFPHTFKPSKKLILSGNPVRESILAISPPEERFLNRPKHEFRVLILGGSLGAKFINEIVPRALTLQMQQQGFMIWHQTGDKHIEEVKENYKQLGLSGKIEGFIEDMAKAYAWADMVIARAGATTLAELSAAGVGSLLIPYPHAVDDHQTVNAELMQNNQAAILLKQHEVTDYKLQQMLIKLFQEKDRCLQMAKAARKLANPYALNRIVEQCLGVSNDRK